MVNFLILFVLPGLTIVGFIWVFRWIMRRWTGYDPIHFNQDFHKTRQLDDYYITPQVRKRKDKATGESHYDRLVEREWAETRAAEASLQERDSEDAAPVPLRALLNDEAQHKH